MKLLRVLAVVATLLGAASGFALAQGVGSSGTIQGTVTDPTGAVVANATVTVADNEKGVKRGTSTDSRGEFVVTGLLPATYQVRTEKAGFESEVHKGIVVNVGQTVTIDFGLKLSAAKEVVEVTTEPPVVDTQRGCKLTSSTRNSSSPFPSTVATT